MSLNQITKDTRKPWLDGRFENLTVDGDFTLNGSVGETFTGTIQWSGAVVGTRSYTATVLDEVVLLSLATLDLPAVTAANINGNPDQQFKDNLVPPSGAEARVVLLENGQAIGGRVFIQSSGQILIDVEYNRIAAGLDDSSAANLYADLQVNTNNQVRYRGYNGLTTVGNSGWARQLNMSYYKNQ